MKTIQTIDIADLSLVRGTQVRATNDTPTELIYREVMESANSNDMFPPIIVFRDLDGTLWIADGHHRVAASIGANIETIQADVRTGTKADAIREAIIANRHNGLPLTIHDRCSAMMMLNELGQTMNNTAMAELLGVSEKTVRRWQTNPASACAEAGKIGNVTTRRIGKDGKNYPAKYTQKPESPKVSHRATTSTRVSPAVSTANLVQSPKPMANSGQPVRIPESGESTQEKIDRLEYTMEYGLNYNVTGWVEFVSIIGRDDVIEFFAKWLDRKMKGE